MADNALHTSARNCFWHLKLFAHYSLPEWCISGLYITNSSEKSLPFGLRQASMCMCMYTDRKCIYLIHSLWVNGDEMSR